MGLEGKASASKGNQPELWLNQETFIQIDKPETVFLIYGMKKERSPYRQSVIQTFPQLASDIRADFLTIDQFANRLIAELEKHMPIAEAMDSFDTKTQLRAKHKKLYAFCHRFYQNAKSAIQLDRQSQKSMGETQRLRHTSTAGLLTAEQYHIPVFFMLDGINWAEMRTTDKDCYTTIELKYLLEQFKDGMTLETVHFVEDGKMVPSEKVYKRLQSVFSPSILSRITKKSVTNEPFYKKEMPERADPTDVIDEKIPSKAPSRR